jgi:phage/plasmid-associated DNA primase
LAGLADYLEGGGLRVPDAVRAATDSYRSDSDTVAAFLSESDLVFDATLSITTNDLMAMHGDWFAASAITESEKAHYQKVITAMKEHGVKAGQTKSRGRYWSGVGEGVPTRTNLSDSPTRKRIFTDNRNRRYPLYPPLAKPTTRVDSFRVLSYKKLCPVVTTREEVTNHVDAYRPVP